jgi:hypothetical protein
MKLKFSTDSLTFYAEFNDSVTAREIIGRLPLTSKVSTWGDEIYFEIGFKASAEGATMDVDVGDIAYWSQGKCVCVFFGPTTASNGEKPVPASPVVIIGKTNTPASQLRKIQLGETIALMGA